MDEKRFIRLELAVVLLFVILTPSASADVIDCLMGGLPIPITTPDVVQAIIYMHPGNETYDGIHSEICDSTEEQGSQVCREEYCVPGFEGTYYWTAFFPGNFMPVQLRSGGGLGSSFGDVMGSQFGIPGLGGMILGMFSGGDNFVGELVGDSIQINAPYSPLYFDDEQWACETCAGNGNGIWDSLANGGAGACCGDDQFGDNPDADQDIDDPDMGEEACEECTLGYNGDNPSMRHWNSMVHLSNDQVGCCGDDGYLDCGLRTGSFLCLDIPLISVGGDLSFGCDDPLDPECWTEGTEIVETTRGPWYWRPATDARHEGVIVDVACTTPDGAFVSDGEDWIACIGEERLIDIETYEGLVFGQDGRGDTIHIGKDGEQEHGYLCFVDPDEEDEDYAKYLIAECCPDGECYNDYKTPMATSDIGGEDFSLGQSRNAFGKTYFCREDFRMEEELDCLPDEECTITAASCLTALHPNETSRGLTWTGTRCCAEPQDGFEYYNDINGSGACFNGTAFLNEQFFEERPDIIVENGQIYGCGVQDEDLLGVEDLHTEEILIINEPLCTIRGNGYYFCDYSGRWIETYGVNFSHSTEMPASWLNGSNTQGGCCPDGMCWKGDGCYINQAPDPISQPYTDEPKYRCSEGEWMVAEPKKGLDGHTGYCPSNDQCLVSISGDYSDNDNMTGNPQCVSEGQYVLDYYCQDGGWNSRTRQISVNLLSLINPSEDYTLFCGPYYDTLNHVDYVTEGYVYVQNLFDYGYANHICVLEYDNDIYLGTSLNIGLDDVMVDIEGIFPEYGGCSPVDDLEFSTCNGASQDDIWINKYMKGIIYSKRNFYLNPDIDLDQRFNTLVGAPVDSLIGILQSQAETGDLSYVFAEDGFRYDRIFSMKKGDSSAVGLLDEDTLVISYENIPTGDYCGFIDAYNYLQNPRGRYLDSEIKCVNYQDERYLVMAYGDYFSNINPTLIWADLTGKLRLE